jgi:glutamate/tyrosine decarboxylase-like PLP-dependent enzyme
MKWEKYSQQDINTKLFEALNRNVHYAEENVLGVPASYLDEKVFSREKHFLKDAPFLSTLVENPNHIGCHTLGNSESFFAGTQEIEKEVIQICAEQILKGEENQFDGYVASGGTEANMQAIWIYRNYFQYEHGATNAEIAILCSIDSHYSMAKSANVLSIPIYRASVDLETRSVTEESVSVQITAMKAAGIKYVIVVANMMTTMFGSVDDPTAYAETLKQANMPFKMHVDGAYGGFYFPFSDENNLLNFSNPDVNSVTLDAHKMAQAPYGTGIFLIRKNWMKYARTEEASYVEGEDCTLIGSRSGANAVAIWMILSKYGAYGWYEKIFVLQKRSNWICKQLKELGINFYRHPHSNIITIQASFIPQQLAEKFGLVPDNHHHPSWYKIVVMEHVTIEKVEPLLNELKCLV